MGRYHGGFVVRNDAGQLVGIEEPTPMTVYDEAVTEFARAENERLKDALEAARTENERLKMALGRAADVAANAVVEASLHWDIPSALEVSTYVDSCVRAGRIVDIEVSS